ncbi:ThuA domain-containing protein, partial [Streptomyces sp. SID7982]|nr:ThuA domain-containing protein [Streptomyces sp. SID7982]
SWCRDYDGGRSFYTAMGGTADSFAETDFRDHLRGALSWTNRTSQADCKATITSNYTAERVTQPNQPGQNDQ